MNVGQLVANLSLNINGFMQGIRQATSATNNLGSNMGGSFQSAQHQLMNTTRSVNELGKSFKEVERIVSGILISQMFYQGTHAIENAASSVMGFINNMEKAKISMEYFLGSTERATGFLLNMKDFAAETAFNTEQALTLSRRLMGAQFKPEQIRAIMETLNDASSATGATAEQVDRIVLALSQMKTNGKIAGQEMRQLAEAGIPIYRILQEELKLTGEEVMNIGDLKISGDHGVAAVLEGLEKRYKGAAARIANTVPGMWETIKDDMLMLSEQIFQGPYRELEKFLRVIRDAMEEAREIMTGSGLGGVFEHFVPPELHNTIRTVIAGMQSMAQSAIALYQALQPVIAIVSQSFLQAMAAVIPPVATLLRIFTTMAVIALQTSPIVRYLAAAIATLLVAQAAAKALMLLWSITKLGAVAMAVARAVRTLTASIVLLQVAISRNPMVAFLILATGWLTAAAFRSDGFSSSIKKLGKTIAGFGGGGKIDDILQPEDKKAHKEWTDPFNESLDDMDESLKDVNKGVDDTGKKAKKAGKKIKDMFVASFDELYQVPDALDELGKGIDDVGKSAGGGLDIPTPTMDMGNMSDFDMGLPPIDPDLGLGDTPDILDTIMDKWEKFKERAKFMWDLISSWSKAAFKNLWEDLKENPYVGWAFRGIETLRDWKLKTMQTIAEWFTTKGAFTKWKEETMEAIKTWAKEQVDKFLLWRWEVNKEFWGWWDETKEGFLKWRADVNKSVRDWIEEQKSDFRKWKKDTGKDFQEWKDNAVAVFLKFADKTTLGHWAIERYKDIKWFADNVKADGWGVAFEKAFKKTKENVTGYFADMWKDVKGTVNSMIDGLNMLIDKINELKIDLPKINIPGVGSFGGGSLGPKIPHIPHLATGGIVLKDQLIRAGEGNRREAVVPLENPHYMKPFSQAVAADVYEMMGGAFAGAGGGGNQPILYVGTLIADDRSLRELDRRMKVVRLDDNGRSAGR